MPPSTVELAVERGDGRSAERLVARSRAAGRTARQAGVDGVGAEPLDEVTVDDAVGRDQRSADRAVCRRSGTFGVEHAEARAARSPATMQPSVETWTCSMCSSHQS